MGSILIFDNIKYKGKKGRVGKEMCYILIKETIEQEDITIKNMHVPNNRNSKYTKEQLKKNAGKNKSSYS